MSGALALALALALLLTPTTLVHAQPALDLRHPSGESLGVVEPLGIVDAPRMLRYVVANVGDATLTVTPRLIEDEFAGATLQNASPVTLDPSTTAELGIWLAPQTWRFGVVLQLESNDPAQPTRTLRITATMRLAGEYTIDNTRATEGRNFHDFGDAFIALEEVGTSAGVTFLVYGQGGPYMSNEHYGLGISVDARSPIVTGDTLPNRNGQGAVEMPLVFRAAPGEQPIIQGDGLRYDPISADPLSGIMALGVSNVTLEGLEFRTATNFAIFTSGAIAGAFGMITIDRCRIHDIAAGPGIAMWYDDAGNARDLVVQNSLLWNIGGNRILELEFSEIHGMIAIRNALAGCVVRHNTLIANKQLVEQGAAIGFFSTHTSRAEANIVNNIIVMQAPNRAMLNLGERFVDVGLAEGNVYWFDTKEPGPFATGHDVRTPAAPNPIPFGTVRYATFADWQADGHDQTGALADPRLVSAASNPPDPRLLPDSPAINRGTGTAVTHDLFANPRPRGSAPDSGAVEFQTKRDKAGIEVRHGNALILPSSAYQFPDETAQGHGTPIHFQVHNIGSATLRVHEVRVISTLNATVQLGPNVPAAVLPGTSAFLTLIVTGHATDWCFDVSITSNAVHRSPYTFRVLGEAGEGEAIVQVRRHPNAVLPGQNGLLPPGPAIPEGQNVPLGEVLVGIGTTQVITLRSLGNIPVELTGTPPIRPFSIVNAEPDIAAAGFDFPPDSGVIRDAAITIIPQAPGLFTVAIAIPNTSHNMPNYFFLFTGTGIEEPRLRVQRTPVDVIEPGDTREFSFVQGQNGTFPFEVLNIGNSPLQFGTPPITIVDDFSGVFSVAMQPPNTLPPSEQATAMITGNANRPGTFVAMVAIHSNDPHQETFLFTLVAHVEARANVPTDTNHMGNSGCGITATGSPVTLGWLLLLGVVAWMRRRTRAAHA